MKEDIHRPGSSQPHAVRASSLLLMDSGPDSLPGVSPQRILVVDDEPDVAEVVVLLLQRDGFEVEAVHSGQAALERLAEVRPYDLIVCDMVMPEMNGAALYRVVQQRPEPRPLMLFLSGYHDAGGHEEFLRAAGVPMVAKPFDVGALKAMVHRLLGTTVDPRGPKGK
jgi:two-component system OmpR family response regulator